MPDVLYGRVDRVEDGNTCEVVLDGGRRVTVRFWGVDAPEWDQPFGLRATEIVREVAAEEPVRIEVVERDRGGHLVGRVQTYDLNVGRTLLRNGYAWYAEQYAPEATVLSHLEKRARRKERGLWEQDNPIPPWQWRKRDRAPRLKNSLRLKRGRGGLIIVAVVALVGVSLVVALLFALAA